RERQGAARMQVQEAEKSGNLVIEAKGVGFRYGDRPVIRGLTTAIMRGDKVGIIGPNGSGKTTLLRLLLGDLPPGEGTIRHGTNLEVAYFDQLKATLDEERTVQQNVSEYETIPINGQPRHVLGYLQDFLFPPERSRVLVKYLSGGERSRLLLAKLFTRPSNVLVLDEPTNDLDIETLTSLEDVLDGWAGTLLVVSHDRYLLERMCDRQVALFGDGQVRDLPGGVEQYLELRREAAARPGAGSGRRGSSGGAAGGAGAGGAGAGGAGAGGAGAGADAAAVRAAKKDMNRIERQLGKLADREQKLHEQMAAAATDHERVLELNAQLREVVDEREELETEWLEAADLVG
ncbi:MAG TPA: ATP-binding cassette domain-containing protein, partial [Segeticoccus sp.]|uniref:ATP-binding cassette domain-containing protein n=1 Tax=Segeticoccus sp. TaxID=2706531 RepID=UPI002D7EA0FB